MKGGAHRGAPCRAAGCDDPRRGSRVGGSAGACARRAVCGCAGVEAVWVGSAARTQSSGRWICYRGAVGRRVPGAGAGVARVAGRGGGGGGGHLQKRKMTKTSSQRPATCSARCNHDARRCRPRVGRLGEHRAERPDQLDPLILLVILKRKGGRGGGGREGRRGGRWRGAGRGWGGGGGGGGAGAGGGGRELRVVAEAEVREQRGDVRHVAAVVVRLGRVLRLAKRPSRASSGTRPRRPAICESTSAWSQGCGFESSSPMAAVRSPAPRRAHEA